MMDKDRRRHPRVTLTQPIRAAIGAIRVYVLDASIGGMRVAHQVALPNPGEFCRLEVPSHLGPIRLDCAVVRTVPEKTLFHSGLQIIAADHQSTERLRSVFETEPTNSH